MTTITFQCYSCNQVLKVGADKAGRKAKCIKCGTILTIPVASDEEAATPPPSSRNTSIPGEGPPRKPAAAAPVQAEFVDEEETPRKRRPDEDEGDDRPRSRRRRDEEDDEDERPRSRRRRDDEEDAEDERPRKRRRDEEEDDEDERPRSRRRRDEEDDEEDERPRKRRRDEDEDDEDDRPRRARARDEDDDEDDDRPRRRRARDDDDEDDDDDRGRRRKAKKSNPWPKVRVGLLLNLIAAGILIGYGGLMVVATILSLIGILAESRGVLDTAGVIFQIATVLFVVLEFPGLAGYILSIFTPNKKGALPMAITATSLGGINLVLKIIFFMVPLFSREGRAISGFGSMPSLGGNMSIAVVILLLLVIMAVLWSEYVIYSLYLRSLAKQLKEKWLEQDSLKVLGFACGVAGAHVIIPLISFLIMRNAGPASGKGLLYLLVFLQLALYAVTTVFAILCMRYIQQVRSRID